MLEGARGISTAVWARALCVAILAAACGRGNEHAADTVAARGIDTGAVAPGPSASPGMAANAPPDVAAGATSMTDPQILTAMTRISQGEIDAGRMAESRATSADVKAFARTMVRDHTQLLQEANQLARRMNVTLAAAQSDSAASGAQATTQRLRSATSGAAFDSVYIDSQVQGHQRVLAMLRNLEGKARAAQLDAMLRRATPVIQRHLARAEELQGRLK